jgi:hypothetical protein
MERDEVGEIIVAQFLGGQSVGAEVIQ